MADTPALKLNDGNAIPALGIGVWQVPEDQAGRVVGEAIEAGYRLIDTAAGYRNEAGVGEALARSPIARDQLFVTTKLANAGHGYDATLKAFDASLEKLRLDYVDLYLIHWPRADFGQYVESWRAFLRLQQEGRIRSVGVSNFTPAYIERLVAETGVWPAVNQIELHPDFQQRDMRQFHAEHGIVTQSWTPLGRARLATQPLILELAAKYQKSWAQIVIRWHLDSGLAVIPRSVTPQRIRDNLAVFNFHFTADEMARLAPLDDPDGRLGPEPDKGSA